jgi:hypothetical protein
MKTLLHEKLFALAVAGAIVFTVFSKITTPLAGALHSTQVAALEAASVQAETIARVFVTGKRMSSQEKVEYDNGIVARAVANVRATAAR